MPGLTMTEKEFWRTRIAARIGKRIEAIQAQHPSLFARLTRDAHAQALRSLTLAASYAELEAIQAEEGALKLRKKRVQQRMLATLRGVPIEEIGDQTNVVYGTDLPQDVAKAIRKRQAAHKEELLANDPIGQEIARWETERENLLDTVWLASSPIQIKQLWSKVGVLLGDEPTNLERERLAIEPIVES